MLRTGCASQGYQFFKPVMNVRAVERQCIEEKLRRALEQNEFEVHYQPKLSLSSGQIAGRKPCYAGPIRSWDPFLRRVLFLSRKIAE